MKEDRASEIYQLKISLKYVRPPIWRRLLIRGDVTLASLHRIIQTAMGWYDSHLHQFIVGGRYYGVPSNDDFLDLNLKDERRTRLREILAKPKKKIVYEYDFGDGWEHEILLEKFYNPIPVFGIRAVSAARAPARPRIAVAWAGTQTFWRPSATRITKSTTSMSIGSAANSIRKSSSWLNSIPLCGVSGEIGRETNPSA